MHISRRFAQGHGISDAGPAVAPAGPTHAGEFRLLSRAAVNETFELWRARPRAGARACGLERPAAPRSRDAAWTKAYSAQAARTVGLAHPHLVEVLAVNRAEGGGPFVIEEWIDGLALDAPAAQDLPPRLALFVVAQAARGLGHAHRAGWVHGALTPGDIRIGWDGAVKVARVGRAVVGATGLSGRSTDPLVHEQLPYLSPEHVSGEAIAASADVYGLGIILYALLSGEVPFKASSDLMTARAVLENAAPRLGARIPGLPSDVETIVERALFKHPNDRPGGVEPMIAALESALDSGPPVEQSDLADLLAARREGQVHRFDRAPFAFPAPAGLVPAGPEAGVRPRPGPTTERFRRRWVRPREQPLPWILFFAATAALLGWVASGGLRWGS